MRLFMDKSTNAKRLMDKCFWMDSTENSGRQEQIGQDVCFACSGVTLKKNQTDFNA